MAGQRTRQRKRPARRENEVLAIAAAANEPQGGTRLEAGLIEHALELALGAIPAPAFVVRSDGEIVRANEAGWAWAKEDARSQEALAQAMEGASTLPCRVTFLRADGGEPHALVVLEIAAFEEMKGLEQAVQRWSLTPRQTEVLALLAEGKTNRLIAATLGCSERTVEIHVAALLEKADCDSRAELIAQFWKPAR